MARKLGLHTLWKEAKEELRSPARQWPARYLRRGTGRTTSCWRCWRGVVLQDLDLLGTLLMQRRRRGQARLSRCVRWWRARCPARLFRLPMQLHRRRSRRV